MRKFAIGKAAPDDGEPRSAASSGAKGAWFREHWRLLSLFAIIIAAFVMRFVFAYGISAGDNYALSGGTSASNNLRIVEEILAGTYSPVQDAALNYPFGSANALGPLFDYVMAAVAFVVTLFGVSDATAAAGVLAWSAPILGALTCIPVYMTAKKMFRGDETIGIVAALFYAFFALLIMTTPFSNGSGFAFICFVAAFAAYFLASAFEAVDAGAVTGPKGAIRDRKVLKYTVLAGLFFAAAVLSWVDFRMYVIVAAVCLALSLVVLRIRGKDMWSSVLVTDIALAIGLIAGACYYIPTGLWDAVFSGGFVLGVLTIVFSIAFAAVEKKPWVVTVPVFLVAIAAVAIAFAFGLPEISDAMTHGNTVYSGSLMQSLVDTSSRTSISSMASYYGWLTLWFPLIYGAWMLYRYRAHAGSRLYGFTALFLLSMFFVGWFNADYAVAAGTVFAIGSAVLTVRIIRAVDMRSYFASLRGNGFKTGARRALKFFPFVTLLVAVFLVAVPNAVYAVDAATPTNDEKAGYYGGLGYTIDTTDESMIDSMWDEYSSVEKTGALVTWIGNANDAVLNGGFKSVTDAVGGGSSTMAAVYLADSSAKAVSAFALRIMLSADISDFKSAIESAGLDYDLMCEYTCSSGAKAYIAENPAEFSGIDIGTLTGENAVYLAASSYIAATITEQAVQTFYSDVCAAAGHYNGIKYVQVDGSMIPAYYNDGSSFATMAYLGNYSLGTYNAVSEYYSINAYTGYAQYTDAMYQTFLWKALFGIDGSEYSSTASLLQTLAAADKSVKVSPGATLDGFTVAYWHVMYNADSSATASSDGWTDMDGYEAIAKQMSEGGVINYLSSVVLLQYGADATSAVATGTVTCGSETVKGVKVEVSSYNEKLGRYVPSSIAFTDENGKYSVTVPAGDYRVSFYTGATNAFDGTRVKTMDNSSGDLVLAAADVEGNTVMNGDDSVYKFNGYIKFVGTSCGKEYQATVTGGAISLVSGMVPDVYAATLYLADGTSVATASVTVVRSVDNLRVSVPTGTVTVTVTDEYGANVAGKNVTLVNTSTGETFVVESATDGTAKFVVPAGTYGGKAVADYAINSTSTVTVSANGSKSLSLTAYDAKTLTITNGTGIVPIISAIGYVASADSATEATVPAPGEVTNTYTGYVLSGGKIGYGVTVYDSSVYSLTIGALTDVHTVTGVVKGADGKTQSGVTVAFVGSDKATFVYTSGSDGGYTAYLPAGVAFTVYAFDGDGEAFYGTVAATDDEFNIALVSAYAIEDSVKYNNGTSSSSTKALPYYGLAAKVTVGGEDYNIYVLTDSNGKATFWAPKGANITVTLEASAVGGSNVLTATDQTHEVTDVSEAASKTFTFARDDSKELSVKKVTITNDTGYELKLKAVGETEYTTVVASGKIDVYPGTLTVDLDALAEKGYRATGSITIYLGGDKTITLDDFSSGYECSTVTVTYNEDDSVGITALENSDGDVGKYEKGTVDSENHTVVYYIENGFDFVFKATGDGKEAIKNVTATSSSQITFDLTQTYETVKVSGYVGVTAKGEMKVTYEYGSVAYSLEIEVSDGNYEFVVPKGATDVTIASVEMTAESGDTTYELELDATISLTVGDEDLTYNFSVITKDYGVTSDVVTVNSSSFAAGVGTMNLMIKNENKYAVTYIVTGSADFVLDKVYTLSIVAEGTGSVTVEGHYDATTIGAGSTTMSVTVADTVGNEVATVTVPASAYTVSGEDKGTSVKVASSEGASADKSAGSVYKYAITIVNNNFYMEKVTINASFAGTSDGWTMYLVDSTGYMIDKSGATFDINGFSTTTFYVMVINTNGTEGVAVPDVKLDSVEVVKGDGSTAAIAEGSITDGTTVTAETVAVHLDSGSVSGGGASDEGRQISTTFWALMILTVLVLLLLIWTGSKRGVFGRK